MQPHCNVCSLNPCEQTFETTVTKIVNANIMLAKYYPHISDSVKKNQKHNLYVVYVYIMSRGLM